MALQRGGGFLCILAVKAIVQHKIFPSENGGLYWCPAPSPHHEGGGEEGSDITDWLLLCSSPLSSLAVGVRSSQNPSIALGRVQLHGLAALSALVLRDADTTRRYVKSINTPQKTHTLGHTSLWPRVPPCERWPAASPAGRASSWCRPRRRRVPPLRPGHSCLQLAAHTPCWRTSPGESTCTPV